LHNRNDNNEQKLNYFQMCRLKIKTKTCEFYNNIERQPDLDLGGCGSGGGSVAGDIEALRKNGKAISSDKLVRKFLILDSSQIECAVESLGTRRYTLIKK
jgi:hypothetical protein